MARLTRFNSRIDGKVNALQQQGRNIYITQSIYSFPTTPHFSLYLPNAEMTLDLEVNEVEVKGLTSLASVVRITGPTSSRSSEGKEGGCTRRTRIEGRE